MTVKYYVQAYLKWLFGVFFGAIALITLNYVFLMEIEGIPLIVILFAAVGFAYPFLQAYMDKKRQEK
ncbi:hypothetical protein EPH95_03530 [Salicibibacter halophilus]|uniref:Uncharacterized protein n=1 Tax=Salicibibacter halophilus TaxID=2502791 RepID=A0A514LGG2_9BACI|nr:hypothetical protein [Salicibibacter halophilus]QDI90361.1 hypothetical protein EPH95_03530 [Salicibibacter halophilus]